MRDPARIDSLLKRLALLWKQWPDLRLGQLIVVLAESEDNVFYKEDDDLLEVINSRLSDLEL